MAEKNKKKTAVKKRPSGDDIKGMLLEGNFGTPSDDPLPMTDPISITHMVLKLNEVKFCDKDPRREKNPKYDEIKASIRSLKKLTHFPNITRRPGDDKYQIRAGGNTRLKILNELYIETGDEEYNRFDCFFIPWISDSNLISEHLIENVMRGEMILIDKAYAIHELKGEIEAERDELISDKKFTQLSEEMGYKLSRTHLIRFNYAVKLDQMIPSVLRSGIGGNKLDYIKKVEKSYAQYCEGRTEQFAPVFMKVMMDNDIPEFWDINSVRRDIDEQLEKLIGVRAELINTEVDAILYQQSNMVSNNEQEEQQVEVAVSDQMPVESSGLTQEPQPENEVFSFESELIPPSESDISSNLSTQNDREEASINNTLSTTELSTKSTNNQPETQAIQLKILQEKSSNLALKIARPVGIEESVVHTETGLGFFMESPSQPFTDNNNTYYTWWLLFGISEQNTSADSHFEMWNSSNIYTRFGVDQKQKDGSLENWIGIDPQVMYVMHELLQDPELMSDKVFTSVFQLMENCRKIRRKFSQRDIWENQK